MRGLRLLSSFGWYFWGIMYSPGNGSSISHQTGIRKIIFKHTWVTGDVWVAWRIYKKWKIIQRCPVTWRSHTPNCHVKHSHRVVFSNGSGPTIRPWPRPHCLLRELPWQRRSWTCEKPGRGRVLVTLGYGERFFEKMWLDGMYEVGYKVVRL